MQIGHVCAQGSLVALPHCFAELAVGECELVQWTLADDNPDGCLGLQLLLQVMRRQLDALNDMKRNKAERPTLPSVLRNLRLCCDLYARYALSMHQHLSLRAAAGMRR